MVLKRITMWNGAVRKGALLAIDALDSISLDEYMPVYSINFLDSNVPALAAFVATSFCVALHMVKLRLYLESVADGRNH